MPSLQAVLYPPAKRPIGSRGVTQTSMAANTDRQPYASPELADVTQIPDDLHRLFAVFGDDLVERQVTREQHMRLLISINKARRQLRASHLEHQRNLRTWLDRDGQLAGQSVTGYLAPDDEEGIS